LTRARVVATSLSMQDTTNEPETTPATADTPTPEPLPLQPLPPEPLPVEIGGPKGPEPTRYGDWERKGRCVDF
jgi:hypothetical protein